MNYLQVVQLYVRTPGHLYPEQAREGLADNERGERESSLVSTVDLSGYFAWPSGKPGPALIIQLLLVAVRPSD